MHLAVAAVDVDDADGVAVVGDDVVVPGCKMHFETGLLGLVVCRPACKSILIRSSVLLCSIISLSFIKLFAHRKTLASPAKKKNISLPQLTIVCNEEKLIRQSSGSNLTRESCLMPL
jgi:hypothetical protein